MKRLTTARCAAGLSVLELSRRVKIDRSYISRIERGEANPTAQCVLTLAQALDVSTDYLLENDTYAELDHMRIQARQERQLEALKERVL